MDDRIDDDQNDGYALSKLIGNMSAKKIKVKESNDYMANQIGRESQGKVYEMKEKYLKVSDFVEFIIRTKSQLMKQIYLEKSKTKKDNELLADFLMKFLINCQDLLDID